MVKTQGVVVADDPVYLSWLQNAVGSGAEFSLVRPLDAEDLLERVAAAGRVDLVLFQFDSASSEGRVGLIERLLERYPDMPVVGLGADGNPETVLTAMRAGARDFFVLKRDDDNLPALLSKVLRRSVVAARGAPKQGRLFNVLASDPSDGIAFLAEHLALACAERVSAAERVLLVDIATPAGAGSVFLNITQTYSVLDAVHDVYRCDQTLVDTAFARHDSGLYVLSLPEDLVGRPQFSGDEFAKLIEVFRSLFAVTVVALDGQLPLETVTGLIAQADRSLLLSDQSILRSRHGKYFLRALRLDDCPLDRTALVVDNYRHRLGLEPENLAQMLDLPLMATLSGQGVNRIQAMNSGEPLYALAAKDSYCRDVRRLAEALMSGQTGTVTAPPGLLGRLLG